MNDTFAPRADAPRRSAPQRDALVWDLPLRVFHWLMAASFAGAYLTAESERWRPLHVTLGYTLVGLVAFRIAWGFVGPRYARFANFVRGPRAVLAHLRSLLRGEPAQHLGHNPAGALAVVALLALALVVGVSGWAGFNDVGGKWLEELHEGAAELMLALVGVHIAGALLTSWLQRENLVLSMIDGRKPGRAEDGLRSARRGVALLLVAAVLGLWWQQWHAAPPAGAGRALASQADRVQDADDDDDD